MLRTLRIIATLLITGLLLHAANLAVRDCSTGLYTFDNCLWLFLSEKLGLPQSTFGRAVALELVGLALLAGLYLTFRYVFPLLRGTPPPQAEHGRRAATHDDSVRKTGS